MIVGCYTLDLYCDCPKHKMYTMVFPVQFTSEHGSRCRAKARKTGWKLKKDGTAICPDCTKKGYK